MKTELRQKTLAVRDGLSQDQVVQRSRKISEGLFSLDVFRQASCLLFYVSYGHEVRTHEMICACLDAEKQVVVPKVVPESCSLVLSELVCWDDLCEGAYHILEPKPDCIREVSSDVLDVVIVPGVVFDRSGNRIGHGLGYYDRLFASISDVKKIGLAFDFQVVDVIPAEPHDVQMDYIVTESEVIRTV
jgi:5-formyltetrahydrofolate cyclo-ligase